MEVSKKLKRQNEERKTVIQNSELLDFRPLCFPLGSMLFASVLFVCCWVLCGCMVVDFARPELEPHYKDISKH